MKVTFNKTTKEERDIELPAFVKFGDHYTKIIDEKNILVVNDWGWNKGIESGIVAHNNPFSNEGWEFITEDEFNKVLLSVHEKLSQFIPVETIN